MKAQESERKNAKLESDLAKANADIDLKRQRLAGVVAEVKHVRELVDSIEKRQVRGDVIDPSVFDRIRDRLTGIEQTSSAA